ncbi:transcription factor IIIA-like [Prunus yedoensis var. nudiflora]|uniref:Transcription factor IIIA-like n=1 Tax=Prunus yedoensis var. nudiflora TaxID=2094558 RepID=A0A314YDY7_PRUYE|nr:transcription factor IIIA-like [Prunus yedoensis var. nudiflora]
MREVSDFNGPVSGGRPPVKLHHVNLNHVLLGIDILKKYLLDNVEHWIPHKELQNARGFDLNGPVPGGRPPGKLHIKQASITYRSLQKKGPCNMRRHVKELHNEDDPSANVGGQKKHVCQDCGKVFKFASKLRKHENSHGSFRF